MGDTKCPVTLHDASNRINDVNVSNPEVDHGGRGPCDHLSCAGAERSRRNHGARDGAVGG
jgi:hypothetical protein